MCQLAILLSFKKWDERLHVINSVKRLKGNISSCPKRLFGQPFRVFFLEVGGIMQQHLHKISSCRSKQDLPLESVPREFRQEPGVVYMGMGEKKAVYLLRIEREGDPVHDIGILTLMHSTIN